MRASWLSVTTLVGVYAALAQAGPLPPLAAPSGTAQVAWSKTLSPAPAYVSDALVWMDSLVVADRGASALRLYGANGSSRAEMVGAHRNRGGLVGFVLLAADGDRLFALSRRRALISLSLPSLQVQGEEPSDLPGGGGRFLAFQSKFVLVGAGSRAQEGPVDYVWSEQQDQAPGGRRALWMIDESLRRFMDLVYTPLVCRAPDGQVAAIRPERLQMALIDTASGGRRLYDLAPPPGYRPRVRPMPSLAPSQRGEYLAWRAEASYLGGLACSGRGVTVLRGEGVGTQTDWFADLYGYDGKLQGSMALPLRATRIVPLSPSCPDCVELLAIQGDMMELGTEHTWVRYATPASR